MGYAFYLTNFNDLTVKLVCIYFEIAYVKQFVKKTFRDEVTGQNFSTVINEKSWFNGYLNSDFDIFYSYIPWPYMNTMIEFDLQFKIFTLVDTTKSYVILNESINKSVSESIILIRYAFYETNFNDSTIKLICLYFEIIYAKNRKK